MDKHCFKNKVFQVNYCPKCVVITAWENKLFRIFIVGFRDGSQRFI